MIKPRYKLVPVADLKPGDRFWCNGRHVDFMSLHNWFIIFKDDKQWAYEGQTHVWKQTALQADACSPRGRGHLGTVQIGSGHPDNISRVERDPRLDEGAGGADAVPREGDSGTADPVQSPAQPRATVRMTRGRDIKPGERVSFIVAQDDPAGLYYNVGNVAHMINPAFFYMVVN